jgi:uncharacterized membrane protein
VVEKEGYKDLTSPVVGVPPEVTDLDLTLPLLTRLALAAQVELSPNREDSAPPESVVTYTHILTNTGASEYTFTITHESSQGWTVTHDSPITVGDKVSRTLVVSVSVPAGAISGTVDTTVITATSWDDSSVSAAVTDTTTVGHAPGVELEPGSTRNAEPGDVVTYTHILTNSGNHTDTFDLSISSGWGTLVLGQVTDKLGAGKKETIVVSVTVPNDASDGSYTTVITAASRADNSVRDTAEDITNVGRVPGVQLGPDREELTEPETVVTYNHTLTNTGNHTDTFDLAVSPGWAALMTSSPITVGQNLTHTFLVSVSVPADAISGTIHTTIITATSRYDDSVLDTATDTTQVRTGESYIYLPLVVRNHGSGR